MVDTNAGTFGGAYADAAPKHMVSYMCGDMGSLANYVYKNFQHTHFYDFSCWSPSQLTGSFGAPIAEMSWKQHIQRGKDRIDIRTDHSVMKVVPPFQSRGNSIRSISAIAIGSSESCSILLGVLHLEPSTYWVHWPLDHDGNLVDGDDGSNLVYLSDDYLAAFNNHRDKVEGRDDFAHPKFVHEAHPYPAKGKEEVS